MRQMDVRAGTARRMQYFAGFSNPSFPAVRVADSCLIKREPAPSSGNVVGGPLDREHRHHA